VPEEVLIEKDVFAKPTVNVTLPNKPVAATPEIDESAHLNSNSSAVLSGR
jgi:hypothetical protein